MTARMHAIICMYLYVYLCICCICMYMYVCEYVWMYFCIHAILHDILSIQNMTDKCRMWVVYPVYDRFQIRMPTHVNLRYSRAVTNFLNCLLQLNLFGACGHVWLVRLVSCFGGILNYCWWKNSRIASWSNPPKKLHLNGLLVHPALWKLMVYTFSWHLGEYKKNSILSGEVSGKTSSKSLPELCWTKNRGVFPQKWMWK